MRVTEKAAGRTADGGESDTADAQDSDGGAGNGDVVGAAGSGAAADGAVTAESGLGVSDEPEAGAGRRRRGLRFRLLVLGATAVVVATAVVLWVVLRTGGPVSVAVPTVTSARAIAECAALTKDAPDTVGGQTRRSTSPASPLTAAWGDPAITLRCGVPEPSVLVPGSPDYDPSAEEIYANGVAWLYSQTSSGYQFIAAQRAVFIEVDVPAAYQPETDAAIDLCATIIEAVPRDDGQPGPDPAPLNTTGP
ncbi:MAG TPA: DUF3515 family protein [Actinocrinis sp.]